MAATEKPFASYLKKDIAVLVSVARLLIMPAKLAMNTMSINISKLPVRRLISQFQFAQNMEVIIIKILKFANKHLKKLANALIIINKNKDSFIIKNKKIFF